MKFVFALAILSVLAAVTLSAKSQKKAEYQDVLNEDLEIEVQEHELNEDAKSHKHHHHHHKHHNPEDKMKYHKHEKHQRKLKNAAKATHKDLPTQEAEIKANKKHTKEYLKPSQEELLLQDVAYETKVKDEVTDTKSPHHYQRGHHKSKQHFAQDIASNLEERNGQVEKKLFEDNSLKRNAEKSVLEDSFEALNNEADKKHEKKAKKHKKDYKKEKKDKKVKKERKNKKTKTTKKEKESNTGKKW